MGALMKDRNQKQKGEVQVGVEGKLGDYLLPDRGKTRLVRYASASCKLERNREHGGINIGLRAYPGFLSLVFVLLALASTADTCSLPSFQ